MSDTAAAIEGIRVLIVEDEAAISLILEEMLSEFGCIIAGSASRLSEAKTLAQGEEIDVAILDVNIAGQEVYPVVEILKERGVSIVFTTGYGDSGVRSEYRHYPIIQKPFRLSEIRDILGKTYQSRR